jgi:acetolactate synthase-1/3 small subunit
MMPTNHTAVHRHIFAVLVENHFGVLGRITGLFSARGFNIESLCVAETEDATVSRITLVTTGDDKVMEQVHKQLHRLIDVIKVTDLSEEPMWIVKWCSSRCMREAEIRAEVSPSC